ncbi:hypothetical protein [Haladaptatus sp. GCM10025707]|uniref:hypothetical protein n=1 Tax=Haladaptatus sp. GCM10025707 TaxID=3252658 RepID=UPI0036F232DB
MYCVAISNRNRVKSEGKEYHLPRDFEGELNLVFVAFRRDQQADVDSWVPFVEDLCATHDGFQYYELPVLSRSYRLVRPFIDGGMRANIEDVNTRERTITAYIDKRPFRWELEILSEHAMHAFLVTRDGEVRWHAPGPLTAGKADELENLLREPVAA